MRRHRAAVLWTVFVLTVPAAIHAFTTYAKWEAKSATFFANPVNADGLNASAVETALHVGLDAWNTQSGSSFHGTYGGRVNDTSIANDGRNVVIFRNTSNGSAIASTYSWWDANNNLLDSDIIFWDGSFTFFTGTGCTGPNAAYVEDIAAHEFGHAIGLNHSSAAGATMYPSYSTCSTSQRSLAPDDIAGALALYPASITPNTAPVAAITSPAGTVSVVQGSALAFDGEAVDDEDGDLSTALTWNSSLEGPLGTGATFQRTLTSIGTHTITARVVDAGGLEGSDSVTVTVTAPVNTAPVVSIAAPVNGTTLTQQSPVTFAGTATDAQDGSLASAIVWTSSLDGPLGTGASLTRALIAPGAHTITARVTDSGGLQGTRSVTVSVVNSAPVVAITAPSSGAMLVQGASATFAGTATDTQDGSLTAALTWSSNLEGPLGTGASVSKVLTVAGTHVITAQVTDSGGLQGSASVTVTVANSAPTVSITRPSSGVTLNQFSTYSFRATATDVQQSGLSGAIVWTSSVEGPLGTSGSLSRALSVPGTHVITARVTDSGGLQGSASITITVVAVNTAPAVSLTAPAPGAALVQGTTTTFTATATDTQDGNLAPALVWTSSLEGPLGTGASVSKVLAVAGTHVVTAQVTDSGGLQGSASVTVTVANSAPVVSITAPSSGSTVTVGTALTLSGTAIDTQQGDLSAGLTWASNLSGALGTGSAITYAFSTPGTHVITARRVDADGLDGSAQIEIVVTNVPPVISITRPIAGATVVRTANNYYAATATDPESGNVSSSLTWSSNLEGVIGSGPAFWRRLNVGGWHTITVTASDAFGAQTTTRFTLFVNSRPIVTLLSPSSGSTATAGAATTFSAAASDPDDGDLSAQLTWTSNLDGVIGTGATFQRTLSTGTHFITVRATDAHGLSTSASFTHTVP